MILSRTLLVIAVAATLLLAGCSPSKKAAAPNETASAPPRAPEPERSPTAPPPTPPPAATPLPAMKKLFPSIRADIASRLIEMDGIVPVNCHDPATPDVYLELIACSPDTREHESLVMTRAKPSHLHAALLAIGLSPGEPGSWKVEGGKLVAIPPRGDPLSITVAYRAADGKEIECPIADWVVTAETHKPFLPRDPAAPRWLFAGSVFVTRQGNEVYDADGAGTVIGLTTFGSEVVAWRDTISPEAAIDTPDWIADATKVPAAGTPVVVRLRPAK